MGISIEEFKKLKVKKNKYSAKPCIAHDGARCPSRKHMLYHNDLVLAHTYGRIKFFLREVPFDLPGGVKHRVDYLIFNLDGSYQFVEVKGRDLYVGKMKRKQVEEIYNIKIEVV
jgi:spore cortex formation protein SpoVR/YcgB (stage V sporulation)